MTYQNEQSPLLFTGGDIDEAMSSRSHEHIGIESPAGSTVSMKNKIDSYIHKRLVVLFSASMLLAGLAGHSISSIQYRRNTSINIDGQVMNQNNETNTFVNDLPTLVDLPALTSTNHHKRHAQKKAKEAFELNLYNPSMAAEKGENYILGASAAQSLGIGKPKDPPPDGCQATVVILRHCEKGSIREHCNAVGFERAKYIATLFGNDAEARWPAPNYLFATAPGDRNNEFVQNFREVETLQPLSEKTGVSIDTKYGLKDEKKFAEDIFQLLRSGDMCGKVALISWKHEDIPRLARKFGCGPEDGCPLKWADDVDFDSTWQISYSYHKQLYPSFVKNEKKNKHKVWGKHPEWWISGYVQMENFDPLQFSKKIGGYQL